MKKRRKTTTSPQYMLPGDDGLEVQRMAYAHGLNTLPRMLFEKLPPGVALPDEFFTNMPTDLAHRFAWERIAHVRGLPELLRQMAEHQKWQFPGWLLFREGCAGGRFSRPKSDS